MSLNHLSLAHCYAASVARDVENIEKLTGHAGRADLAERARKLRVELGELANELEQAVRADRTRAELEDDAG
jgi:hypothetical protein